MLSPVHAQDATNAPITGPDVTTARYGDWLLRCAERTGTRSCEMVQRYQERGKPAPLAMFSVGRLVRGGDVKLVAQLPINVTFANGVTLEAAPGKPLAGVLTRCLPVGCFAEVILPDDVRKDWINRTEPGTLSFHNAALTVVTVPLSFRGFGAAFRAMEKDAP